MAVAAALALAGCGDDDEEPARTTSTAPPATVPVETVMTETTTTATDTTPSEPEPEETQPEPPPEEQEGGAGDEEPARTLALFTARDGRITPRAIRVPAFISVQVELRSADGRTYTLKFGDTKITAGGELSSRSTTIDGLRPGEGITGRPVGAGNLVRVEATAEPGP